MYVKKNKVQKKYRKYRRYFSKKKVSSRMSRVVVRGPKGTIFPDRYFTKLRFNKIGTLSGGIGPYLQLAMNNLYDIDPAGGALTQPMGFDQLGTMYDAYKVHRSSIKITWTNVGTQPCTTFVFPATNVLITPSATLEQDLEQRYSKSKILTSINAMGTCILRHGMSISKITGDSYLDDKYEGTQASAPSIVPYWNIAAFSIDGVTNVNAAFNIEVTYWVEFTSPKNLTISS